jgi:hypothetical protein
LSFVDGSRSTTCGNYSRIQAIEDSRLFQNTRVGNESTSADLLVLRMPYDNSWGFIDVTEGAIRPGGLAWIVSESIDQRVDLSDDSVRVTLPGPLGNFLHNPRSPIPTPGVFQGYNIGETEAFLIALPRR